MTFYQPRSRIEDNPAKWFKVMNGSPVIQIYFTFVARHRSQIEHNHGQTLEELNARGGLDWYELYCGITGRGLFPTIAITTDAARQAVIDAVARP